MGWQLPEIHRAICFATSFSYLMKNKLYFQIYSGARSFSSWFGNKMLIIMGPLHYLKLCLFLLYQIFYHQLQFHQKYNISFMNCSYPGFHEAVSETAVQLNLQCCNITNGQYGVFMYLSIHMYTTIHCSRGGFEVKFTL